MVNLQNDSFDLLMNGFVVEAAVKSYEEAWTFGGVIWFWPIVFLITLVLVAIKSENPTLVGMYAILGTVALGTRLPVVTDPIFALIVIFSILIWFFSLFISRKTD